MFSLKPIVDNTVKEKLKPTQKNHFPFPEAAKRYVAKQVET
jgi:hypothetical protein